MLNTSATDAVLKPFSFVGSIKDVKGNRSANEFEVQGIIVTIVLVACATTTAGRMPLCS